VNPSWGGVVSTIGHGVLAKWVCKVSGTKQYLQFLELDQVTFEPTGVCLEAVRLQEPPFELTTHECKEWKSQQLFYRDEDTGRILMRSVYNDMCLAWDSAGVKNWVLEPCQYGATDQQYHEIVDGLFCNVATSKCFRLFKEKSLYIEGEAGVDACPSNSTAILNDEKECRRAAAILGESFVYYQDDANAVCNVNPSWGGVVSTIGHGVLAKWVCKVNPSSSGPYPYTIEDRWAQMIRFGTCKFGNQPNDYRIGFGSSSSLSACKRSCEDDDACLSLTYSSTINSEKDNYCELYKYIPSYTFEYTHGGRFFCWMYDGGKGVQPLYHWMGWGNCFTDSDSSMSFFRTITAPSLQSCMKQCRNDENCLSVTWRYSDRLCKLHQQYAPKSRHGKDKYSADETCYNILYNYEL